MRIGPTSEKSRSPGIEVLCLPRAKKMYVWYTPMATKRYAETRWRNRAFCIAPKTENPG